MAIVRNSFSVSRIGGDVSQGTVSSREEDESFASPACSSDVGSDTDSGMGFDEIDLSEFGDPGMEFCQVGNQSCSIPLELYDLTDLSGVLSLETWNNCLTEQERFTLAEYLPDMEQEGFAINLKELFSGTNFFFGNPLTSFFNILRAGLCDPRVVLYRQGLHLLRQRRYYHMLGKFQDSMVGTLIRMKSTWNSCAGYGIEQKVRVLNILRTQKSLCYDKSRDLGSDTNSEGGDSTEVYWNKKFNAGREARKSFHKAPFDGFSQGRNMTMEPIRFGKEKSKGILKVAAPEVCKKKKAILPLSFNSITEKKAGMTKRKDYSSEYGLLNGGGKRDLSNRYVRDLHTDFGEEDHERYAKLSDYHGRGRSSNHEVTVATYDYDHVHSAKKQKQKHSARDSKCHAKDVSQHRLPKISQGSAAAQSISHHKVDGEPFTPNKLERFDDWNVRGKRLKVEVHHKSGISRSGLDSEVISYKNSPAENGEPVFLPGNRMRISHGKMRDKSSYQQSVSKDYPKVCTLYEQNDDTESDSSDQDEEDHDKYPYACRSELPRTVIVKSTTKTSKSSKKDNTRPLGGVTSVHTQEGDPYSKKIRQKGRTNNSSNLQEGKSARKGQSGHRTEKLHPSSLCSYSAARKKKVSADFCRRSHQSNEPCNVGSDLLDEAEYNFDANTNLRDVQRKADRPENINQIPNDCVLESDHYQSSDMPLVNKFGKGEDGYLEDSSYQQFSSRRQIENSSTMKKKGKRKADALAQSSHLLLPDEVVLENGASEMELEMKTPKKSTPITPTIHTGFSFSIIHLLSAVRKALISSHIEDNPEITNHLEKDAVQAKRGESKSILKVANGTLLSHSLDHVEGSILEPDGQTTLPSLTIQEIVNCVKLNPGDSCILETQEPLQDLVRGALKIFSSRTAPLGAKGWKALVIYEKSSKSWAWVGPVSIGSSDNDNAEETSAETWSIPHKMLVKLVDAFANWLKSGQETLRQIGSLPAPPSMLPVLDEKERFRDLRAQKSLNTIRLSSEEVREYFRKEELLRYSIPDRAFQYTAVDGRKSIVAPLRRGGGKPTSKARDHFMLKPDRPPHVTVLCLVRDSAARLPGSVGTRADVCTLIRDSQYIVEDVTDAQINQVVSGALDRLHYERDPCVQFDGDRKLWVYLHRDREDEDFEDDGTSSTKKWKRQRKDVTDNSDMAAINDSNQLTSGDLAAVGSYGYDFHPDLNIDSSATNLADNGELVFSNLRPTMESFQSYVDTVHSERRQDNPLSWEELGVNHLQENKMLCQENSIHKDFDDQSFCRDRPGEFLNRSLL